jgi:hypothetical protein
MMHKKVLGLTVLLLACSGEQLDMGDDPTHVGGMGSGGTTGGSAGGPPIGGSSGMPSSEPSASLPEWSSQTDCETDVEFADLVGTWEGQVEDFYLKPVQTLRVVINGASAHGICGSVTWGDGEAPAPATDPDAPYPSAEFWQAGLGLVASVPVEGFAYGIDEGAVRAHTVRFSTQVNEPWRSWCEIQTSYSSSLGYSCMPFADQGVTTTSDPNGVCETGGQTFTAFKCYGCERVFGGFCACDAGGCTAKHDHPSQFDLTLSDDATLLTGPADYFGYNPGEVSFYLKRID